MPGSHGDGDRPGAAAAAAASEPDGRQHLQPPRPPQPHEKEEGDGSGVLGPETSRQTTGANVSSASSVGTGHTCSDDGETGAAEAVSRVPTHVSLGPDNPVEAEQLDSNVEIPDEVYNRFSPRRKLVIVSTLSFCSFLAPMSSTAVLSAVPEVAEEYHTNGTIINLSNALYMLWMGLSPCLWGPLSQVYGRRIIHLVTAALFLGCSIGTALAPNLAAFYIFRILTAFEGTSFIMVGSTSISDIYRPTERATALAWFMSGTLVGPALGPLIGGIIVTFRSWRVIFWLQSALAGIAVVGVFFLLPETAHHRKIDDLVGCTGTKKARVLWSMINPVRVVRLYRYPNLALAGIASSALLFNMYSLLTPIRYVLNPRFHLTSPLQSGLIYLAPGCGYLAGTFVGGRYADHVVRRWIVKRGVRIPEDRLRSAAPFMGIVIPACTLVYGWGVEKDKGGIALAVVALFLQGVAQLFCFPSLNTYCLDVSQSRASEVIASNYAIRYLFACAGTAAVLPAVQAIGVGWFSTISALFTFAGSVGLVACVVWGKKWRDDIDIKKRAKRRRRRMAEREAEGAESGAVEGGGTPAQQERPGEEKEAQQEKEEKTDRKGWKRMWRA